MEMKVNNNVDFSVDLDWYPTLDKEDHSFTRMLWMLRSKLSGGWSVELKTELDYNSDPPHGRQKDNVIYTVNVGYRF